MTRRTEHPTLTLPMKWGGNDRSFPTKWGRLGWGGAVGLITYDKTNGAERSRASLTF